MSKLVDEMVVLVERLAIELVEKLALAYNRQIEEIKELKAEVARLTKFKGMYGFEKMEVARHVKLYKDYQKKFKTYYYTAEKRIAMLEEKVARYERDVSDDRM